MFLASPVDMHLDKPFLTLPHAQALDGEMSPGESFKKVLF